MVFMTFVKCHAVHFVFFFSSPNTFSSYLNLKYPIEKILIRAQMHI